MFLGGGVIKKDTPLFRPSPARLLAQQWVPIRTSSPMNNDLILGPIFGDYTSNGSGGRGINLTWLLGKEQHVTPVV